MPLGGQFVGSVASQAGINSKMSEAMSDLALKGERQRKEKAIQEKLAYEDELKEKENIEKQNRIRESYLNHYEKPEQSTGADFTPVMSYNGIERLRKARLRELKEERSKKGDKSKVNCGDGEVEEIFETNFLEIVTKTKFVIVHFYKREFEKCTIVTKLLKKLSKTHLETKFCSINSDKTPFFVEKLNVRVLPNICCFIDGKKIDQILGFDFMLSLTDGDEEPDLTKLKKSDFENEKKMFKALERRFGICGVIKMDKSFYTSPTIVDDESDYDSAKKEESSDDEEW